VRVKTPGSIFGPTMWLESHGASIWVSAQDRIAQIDPVRAVVTKLLTPPTPDWGPIALGFGSIWMSTHSSLYRFNLTGRTVAAVSLPQGPIVVAFGAVWAVEPALDVVAEVDPRTNAVLRTVKVGTGANAIASGDGAVWVASSDGTVSRIDPATADVVATIDVGGSPQDVTVAGGRVWVSSS
jgi:YVTN family beta-propeller protein